MRKISSYLYPNRIQLLADVAGSIPTEYTNVYQRTVKIYKGVDNVLEFDIKNSDQKRIELVVDPVITNIQLNVMDSQGNSVGTYPISTATGMKGIATVTIPTVDLDQFTPQFFRYSVTAVKGTATIPLYADSRFGAVGTIELVGNAMPTTRTAQVFTTSYGEINLVGEVITHSPAIPTTFYEAITTTEMNIHADIEDFIGKLYVQGTTSSTITVESWRDAPKIMEFTFGVATTTTVHIHPLVIGDYKYFRVTWENSSLHRATSDNPAGIAGKVTKITADIGAGEC
jgi:hypothetical protein